MLIFSPTVQAIVASGKGESFYVVSIHNGDGSLFRASTTHHSDVTLENGITYESDGYIVSVDPPRMSSTVDRDKYTITLADPDYETAAQAENAFVGKKLEVRLCFLDTFAGNVEQTSTDGTIFWSESVATTGTGLPLTTLADSLIMYKGRVEGLSLVITLETKGESLMSLSGASPMMSLDTKKGLYLSREVIRSLYPDDGCCDAIYEGSGALVLKWGRA